MSAEHHWDHAEDASPAGDGAALLRFRMGGRAFETSPADGGDRTVLAGIVARLPYTAESLSRRQALMAVVAAPPPPRMDGARFGLLPQNRVGLRANVPSSPGAGTIRRIAEIFRAALEMDRALDRAVARFSPGADIDARIDAGRGPAPRVPFSPPRH